MRTVLLTLALLAPAATAWAEECQPTAIPHPSGDPALEFIDFTAADRCAAGHETDLTLAIQSLAFGLLVAGAFFIGFRRQTS